jgi:small-conductance mechanosensitive channel
MARRRSARRRYRGGAQQGARTRLRGFRQATILAVALTAFLLILLGADETTEAGTFQDTPAAAAELPDTVALIEDIPVEDLQAEAEAEEPDAPIRADTLVRAAAEEARGVVRGLWYGLLAQMPRFLVAAAALVFAWLLVRLVRPVLRRAVGQWDRGNAFVALFGIVAWLLAIGVAVSVIAGDVRAMLGSLGLIGLALSWALQTPIESFTGWLLNSFRGYYRVGDRVAVGEVFGDVYQIDPLNTTVWEIGSPGRGFVQAEQPTGRLITFPNNEVLAGSIVNLTRDFPYVWDEVTAPVGNKSDMVYATSVLLSVAKRVIGEQMVAPAGEYERILLAARLETSISREPQVFVSMDDSWTNLTVRYLVAARERRRWGSMLAQEILTELNRPEHSDRIISVFPRRQIQFIGPDGKARELPGTA